MTIEQCWNDNNTGKPKNRRTTCLSAPLYTISPTMKCRFVRPQRRKTGDWPPESRQGFGDNHF